MKLSDDGFDARRLRPKGPKQWRMRLGAAFAALLVTLGVLLGLAGAANLLGRPPALEGLDTSTTGGAILLAIGLVLLYLGIALWRRCRRRMRRGPDLAMAPGLMKKHD
ncbi:hypothetical protein [Pseudomonas typographi]|uniref:Uncharacterized protein n=1 Tax=Pseudomonas typographi TaxID=2715964 RepID=A0ABR7Z0K9_9PSED|nr:hypothetical protein [Pseudomonas typographi]MBD1550719.1 hypothetical protein [Pseudomonas typographi]MBD1589327.1 hypothetical protein [Pseudomonas typographi]MBD1599005.1 hypothetical protein [Pseudomonas typographi]